MNKKENFFGDIRKHLMSGVSIVLPVIIIYAFFMVLGQVPGAVGEMFVEISAMASMLIAPILAAYIAHSIVGKLALAPTFVIGLFSDSLGMGFIGGIVVGLVMGYIIKLLIQFSKKFKQGQGNDILMAFIIIPVVSVIVGGLIINFVIAAPLTVALAAVYNWLETTSTGNTVFVAAILGAMIAFDMGGPVNKIAYTFALAAATAGLYHIVAPVLVAITIPVLAVALATIIGKNKYSEEERIAGKSALFMSIFGFTEGAIPFAVVNPFRVIPALMAGSVVGASLAALLGLENTSVIPSLMGLFLGSPTVGDGLIYVLCHIVGVAVAVTLLLVFKQKEEVELA